MQTEIEKRKQKFISLIRSKLFYILTGLAIYIGAFIRTRNLPLLKDKLFLGLDPYVFYRYTKYIVEHGSLMTLDKMRYVPLGYNPTGTGSILSYILAYIYKAVNIFLPSLTFEKFNILYPVIAFIFAMIIFFLLVKKLFNTKIAALATAFLAVLPGFIFRTLAGFSEKEPIGILFMFLTFYLYILAIQAKKLKIGLTYSLLSGLFFGLLSTIWGGVNFIFVIIPLFTLIIFILKRFSRKKYYVYGLWFIIVIIGVLSGGGYSISSLFTSFIYATPAFVFFVLLINFILFELNLLKLKEKIKDKFPIKILSLLISIFFSFIAFNIIFSPSFLIQKISELAERLIHPMGTSRFVLTVAEAHQPYFTDWKFRFYYFFHIFFLGSILLFYNFLKPIKRTYKKIRQWKKDEEEYKLVNIGSRYQLWLTILYTLFISAFIFSRYSQQSILNGENFISNLLYIGSLISFTLILFALIIYLFFKNKEVYNRLRNLNEKYIFVFIWFLLTVVGARGALRLFFVFTPITAVLGAYFIIKTFNYLLKIKNSYNKVLAYIFLILILMAPVNGSLLSFTKISYESAKIKGPSFNNQWQKAMSWVKQNTPKDAVFAHWWDYGYWVQTMGERATILDGGNALTYWNHLMGRHVLTGRNPEEALEFLKAHKATHLLIISDEIRKYGAYSSLGSDESNDRLSFIPTFMASKQDVQETKNESLYLYQGKFILDEDFIYKQQIFSKDFAFIAGIIVPVQFKSPEEITITQPTAIIISNGQRYDIPLECVFYNNQEINFEKQGVKGCLMLIPEYNINTKKITQLSTAIYLSENVRNTLFTQLFLFNAQWPGFELVYDDSQLGWPLGYLKNKGNVIGPIKIWKINYPPDIREHTEYLKTN